MPIHHVPRATLHEDLQAITREGEDIQSITPDGDDRFLVTTVYRGLETRTRKLRDGAGGRFAFKPTWEITGDGEAS